jgi:hypothetical protein
MGAGCRIRALHRDFPKTGDVKGFTDQLVTASSPVLPVAVTMFAGSLDAINMNFDERNLTSLVKFPTGDFCDLDTIAACVRALAGKMGLCGGMAKTDGICRRVN